MGMALVFHIRVLVQTSNALVGFFTTTSYLKTQRKELNYYYSTISFVRALAIQNYHFQFNQTLAY